MVIYCERNGNVRSIPSVIPFGEKLTDITIVTPQQSATVLLKIEPPTGEVMPDMICAPVVNDEGILVYNAKVFPGVTVAAGRCYYQLQFVGTGRHVEYDENGKEYLAEESPSWNSEKGSFNILRGTNIDLPLSEQILKDYALEELYTLLESITQVQYRASAIENKIGIDKELETEEKNIIDAINAINSKPSVSTDPTLTKEGSAADAKITGEKFVEVQKNLEKKVSYTDIVDNLTENLSDKPLSAKQGYNLNKRLEKIEQIPFAEEVGF